MKLLDKSSPQFADLQAILTIIQEGTITRAARRLGTTQSALSYHLDRMRKRFDDALFVRVGHQMSPTPLAQRLADPATRIMRILETEVVTLARFDPATTTREFRIGVNEIGAITLIPPLVQVLAQRAPNATVTPMRVDASSVTSLLDNGDLDLAAGHFVDVERRLIQQLLYRREYVCVARIGHPTVGEAITIQQFQQTPLVWTSTSPQTMSWVDTKLHRDSDARAVRMITHHFAAVPFIVGASDFISLVPCEIYEMFRHITPIKSVRLPLKAPRIEIHQYWHPRLAGDPELKFFRELVYEVAQDMQEVSRRG